MLGFYDYTVILTFASVVSASTGVVLAAEGIAEPWVLCLLLMFSGLCDAFDGFVARSKKNRSEDEKAFGIQIDSMSDLIAFGILPACIAKLLVDQSPVCAKIASVSGDERILRIMTAVIILYILAAVIRLSYFNVSESKRQREESGCRTYFEGIPVTTAAVVFPLLVFFQYFTVYDITLEYIIVMVAMGFLFISKVRIPKPCIDKLIRRKK